MNKVIYTISENVCNVKQWGELPTRDGIHSAAGYLKSSLVRHELYYKTIKLASIVKIIKQKAKLRE